MTGVESLRERTAQLLEELAHADGLIDRLVAENERLRARVEQCEQVIAALRSGAAWDRGLSLVEGGRSRSTVVDR